MKAIDKVIEVLCQIVAHITVLMCVALYFTSQHIEASPILTNADINQYQYAEKLNSQHEKAFISQLHKMNRSEAEAYLQRWKPELLKEKSSFFSKDNSLVRSQRESRQPVLLFISFSMPAQLLNRYQMEASQLHIPMVLRGLYHNSFKRTAQKLFLMMRENNKGGVLIDPLWYQTYHIHKVPALVVRDKQRFDVIYGNISIDDMLKKIKNHDQHFAGLINQTLGESA